MIAEQQAIPFDQLARFLGCEEAQAARVAKHLFKSGFADYGRILHGEPHWIWPTGRGARLSGTGFEPHHPRVGAMARVRAVNEIRMHIAYRAPEARWICGRSVVREQGQVRPLAKRSGRDPPRAPRDPGPPERPAPRPGPRGVETHMARYDAVIAFANPKPRKRLERLAADNHWPKLVVRSIPEPAP